MMRALRYLWMFQRRIRYLRRQLSWHDSVRLAFAKLRGADRIKILLPGLKTSVELRLNTADVTVLEKIWFDQEYLPPYQVEPRFIVDAGANTGLSALYFSYLFPMAEIVALEPEPANYLLLTQNCAANARIRPLQAALWGRSTALRIADTNAASWAFQMTETSTGDSPTDSGLVSAVTIPQLLAQYGRDRVDVLKLDIEGAERELFTPACQEWLPKVGLLIIELHDRYHQGCSHAVYSELVRRPFSQEQRGENIFILPEQDIQRTPK